MREIIETTEAKEHLLLGKSNPNFAQDMVDAFSIIPKKNSLLDKYFSQLPRKEGSIDISKLSHIGGGGSHNIFLFRGKGNEAIVLKIKRQMIENNTGNDISFILKSVNQHNNQYKELYDMFGEKFCIKEKEYQANILYNNQIIDTIISLQDFSNIYKEKDIIDFSTHYPEIELLDGEKKHVEYVKMNNSLLSENILNYTDIIAFSPKSNILFKKIDHDKEFQKAITNFFHKLKLYIAKTGNIIDIVGKNNVIFYKKGDEWKYKIGTVLKFNSKTQEIDSLVKLKSVVLLLNHQLSRKSLKKDQQRDLLNGLTFLRFINAIGLKCGVGKISELSLNQVQLENLHKMFTNSI